MEKDKLYFFYGEECPHCHKIMPLVKQVKKELNVEVELIEVWHNEKNEKILQEVDNGQCGGVPFFFNSKTKAIICGETDLKSIKKWAQG